MTEKTKRTFHSKQKTTKGLKSLWLLPLMMTLSLLTGCEPGGLLGQITVDKIVNPDEVPPVISFLTIPGTVNGDQDMTLDYTVEDDPKGGGIASATLYYTPDVDNDPWKSLGAIPFGTNSVSFCVPNKNHPKPAFKIVAVDLNGNTAQEILGDEAPLFSITPKTNADLNSLLPTVTSDDNGLTNQLATDITVDSCPKTNCSLTAKYYEPPTNDIFFAVTVDSPGAPATGDPSWVSCTDAINNGMTLPDLTAINGGDGNKTVQVWAKSEETDYDGITPMTNTSTTSSNVTVTYDTTPPDESVITVVGSTFIKKARGEYLVSDCSDIAQVLITDNGESAPAAGDTRWQTCTDTTYTLYYNDLVSGTNNLRFWLKDAAENVQTTFLPYTTEYAPASITVVDGPTINTSVASMTIDICEEVDMTHVLFNFSGTKPDPTDSAWQTCSKAVGALSSPSLSPGNNTLKAFFKYDDDFVSVNPIDVPVTYSPSLTWDNAPSRNRPDMTFTGYNCTGIKEVFFNQDSGSKPAPGAVGWQTCSTTAGAYSFEVDGTSPGTQAVYAWFKATDDTVFDDYDTISVTYNPPTATRFGGSNVSTTNPALSVDDCNNIDKVYVKLNETVPLPPNTADFDGAGGMNCTTALNGITNVPTLPSEGNHFYDVWFRFTDGYILPHAVSDHRVNLLYVAPDTTPPTIVGTGAGNTDVTVTLTNGDAGTPQTILANASRAHFTVNDCTPMTPVTLTGTVSVSASNNAVTGVGTTFTTELSVGDFVGIAGEKHKVKTITDNTNLELVTNHVAGASGVIFTQEFPEDDLTHMIWKSVVVGAGEPTAPASDDADWVTCSEAASAFKTKSFASSGTYDLYAYFKDSAGNVSATLPETQFADGDRTVTIDLGTPVVATDVPRPNVFLKNAPTVVTPPAQFRIEDCTGLDQVYLEPSTYPSYTPQPTPGQSGWQDCSTVFDVNNITYDVDLKGSYTISVWFKEPGGVINPTPRDIAFIFDPTQGSFATPLAMWTLDNTSRMKNRFVDAKGDSHLYIWNPSSVSSVTAKVDEGVDLDGTNSYLFTENTTSLRPTISVTLSLWAYITNGDAGTKGLAGNIDNTGGYGLRLNGGNLEFHSSGTVVSEPTTNITTGWNHIIGTSDGRYLDLYVNGQLVANTDLTTPANLTYGCGKLFVVGGNLEPTCTGVNDGVNPKVTELFDDKIDEIVVFPQYFTAQNALDHYIDSFNDFHVNEDTIGPADITSASFYGEFMQNILMTTPSCGDAKYIYVDETTHPPLVDTSSWQLCSDVLGATVQINKPQGAHEIKIWAKDEYDNISSGYLKLDTSITDTLYKEPPLLYYSFDADRKSGTTLYDPYSLQHATNNGAAEVTSGLQNESLAFVRAENDYVERKYAYNAQPTSNITFSVWAKLEISDNTPQVIAGTRVPADAHGYSFEIDSNELRFFVETSGGPRQVGVPTSSYSTGWHNIIGTYDGRVQKLYIDAVNKVDFDHLSTLPIQYAYLGNFVVGAGATKNQGARIGTHFNNEIDEVLMWDSVMDQTTINGFFYGQDTVPPEAVAVDPKDNAFTVGIPEAKFNVEAGGCADIASVYVTLGTTKPTSDIAGWQACSESGDQIISPLLADGANNLKFWFKDASGNVSNTSTDLTMTFNYDFTIPNPNSYYTLDTANIDGGTVFDVVSGKNGDLFGTSPITGQEDQALTFDGTDDYIEVPYDASFQPTNTVTLSAWFNSDSLPTADEFIAGNLNGGGYALVLANGFLEFRVEADGATQVAQYDTTPLSAGTWYHVVGVWDDGTIRLFVNGVEEVNTTLFANMPIDYANNNSFVIGAAPTTTTGASGSYFTGGLDEISFFQSALTDTVISEMYNRGVDGDKIWYDVEAPEIPTTANLLYYNSLVSRANLTFTDCTGLNYVIVTKDVFPPDKNDEDWQPCNTVTGGILTKELRSTDAFGKLWTKDNFGNVSKDFEYVPITTKYDLPIQRPVVHWTFDSDHYTGDYAFDRMSNINLKRVRIVEDSSLCTTVAWSFDENGSTLPFPGPDGVLNKGMQLVHNIDMGSSGSGDPDNFTSEMRWLRSLHPNNIKVKPEDKLSVAVWAYLPANGSHNDEHIVSTELNNKGWSIRMAYDATSTDHRVYFTVHTDQGTIEPYLETQNYSTGWHLIHGVFDGANGSAKLYFDGIFIKEFSVTAPAKIVYEPNAKLHVGVKQTAGDMPNFNFPFSSSVSWGTCSKTSNSNTKFFKGKIDEILIWDEANSGLEASSLYHNGADILYSADTTPPGNPSLTLENSEPELFTDKAFYTVDDCFKTLPSEADHIAGVLVNEGTQPDKQDERWRICRTRLGSFGLENLTPGGHTITTWFKDRAGNVTPVSSDIVVNYNQEALPQANAFWPLDSSSRVSRFQRNIIKDGEHDLLITNFDNPANPTATMVPGKVDEAMNLAAPTSTLGSYLTAKTTRLLRPVNYFSVGGWFYIDTTWADTRYLIDHREYNSVSNKGGYSLLISGGNLQFVFELSIAGTRTLSTDLSLLTTGWNHIIARFDGFSSAIFVNGIAVTTDGPYAERDFTRYDDPVDFRIGAKIDDFQTFKYYANPTNFFNERVDEIGVWGYDMSDTAINNVITANDLGNHSYPALTTPNDVDNAYVYFYDLMANRARMTMLDCVNTPYVYIQARPGGGPGTSPPTGDEIDWVKCRTEPGALVSAKLPVGTTYVEVYAKNADGVVSSGYATREIDPVVHSYDPVLPTIYYSLNAEHSISNTAYDFMSNVSGGEVNATSKTTNDNGGGINFNGSNTYVSSSISSNYNLRDGFTHNIWAYIDNSDTATRILSYTDYYQSTISNYEYLLRLNGGQLQFFINVNQPSTYTRGTSFPGVGYPISKLSTGIHMITTQYDGQELKLYIDGQLMKTLDVGYRSFATSAFRFISFDRVPRWIIGSSSNSWSGEVDEHMLFDHLLTEPQINDWFYAYKDDFNLADDTTAPATIPTIAVTESTEVAGKWPTTKNNPVFTLDDCTDIAAVLITLNSVTAPTRTDTGWQTCLTDLGHFTSPTLSTIGDNTLNFWFKDEFGNVTSGSQDIIVTYSEPTIPNPVAYWSMDDTTLIQDRLYESVSENNAYLYYADFIGHNSGTALNFDGSRKYAEVEHNSAFKPTEEITISAWIEIPTSSDDRVNDYIIDTRGSVTEGYYWRWVCSTTCTTTNSPTREYFEWSLSLDGVNYTLDIPQNQIGTGWKHFVTTFDGRYMRLYVDKVLRRTVDTGGERSIYYDPSTNVSLIFGANATDTQKPSNGYFHGKIDEVAIYDKAIHQYQIDDLFDNYITPGTRIYGPTGTPATPANINVTRWEPTSRPYGDRMRFTVSDCTGVDMILINDDSVTAPAANSPDWQMCNTLPGGILSAPLADGVGVAFATWGKTFDGQVTASAGSANGETYTETFVGTIPRSRVHWSLDSGASTATTISDLNSNSEGIIPVAPNNPTSTANVIENGFSFDGTDDFITIKPTPATNPFYNFTISAWAELTRGDTQHRHIVGNLQNGTSENGAGVGLRVYGGELQFYVNGINPSNLGTTFYQVGIDSNLYSTGFHHVVGTYDGRSLNLFLDGVLVKTYNIPFYGADVYQTVHDDYSSWTIGAESSGVNTTLAGSYFFGKIDDIRIFDQKLSELEVYRLYDYGSHFLPSNDGISDPPTDPGIFISDGLTSTGSPWARFTMPSCTGGNGEPIDSVYVNIAPDPAPTNADLGWQYCTTDDAYITSSLLARGTSTIQVYFRDEEGDISTASTFTMTYVEPEVPLAASYYTFDSTDKPNLRKVNDLAGYTPIRRNFTTGIGWSGTPGDPITEEPYLPDITSLEQTTSEQLISPNFTVAFWYRATNDPDFARYLIVNPMISIRRLTSDNLEIKVKTSPGETTIISNERFKPGKWTHVAVARQSNSLKVYFNGREINSHVVPSNANPDKSRQLQIQPPSSGNENYQDELIFFNEGLSSDQVAYLYWKGSLNENVLFKKENRVPASIPDHYFTFDDADYSVDTLNDVVGTLQLKNRGGVQTGEAVVTKYGQSFNFTRYESNLNLGANPPESTTNNPIGTKQFLETDGATPLALGANFTVSVWIKRKDTYQFGDDRGAILDQWGNNLKNQSFQMVYNRAAGRFEMNLRINNNVRSVTAPWDLFSGNTNWLHVQFVRRNEFLAIYVNGDASGISTLPNNEATMAVDLPEEKIRLRVGESSLYPIYDMPGTVSIASNTTVTGTGTDFLNDLQTNKTGTVSVTAGTTTVTGTGTSFFNELSIGDIVNIGGEFHEVASITNPTELELVTTHVAGASGLSFKALKKGRLYINGEERNVVSIASSTSLEVDTAFTATASGLTWQRNICPTDCNGSDEWGLKHYIDELAIWNGVGRDYGHATLFYEYNNANPISLEPRVALKGFGGNTVTQTNTAELTLSDCGNYTDVYVGLAADPDPLSGDPGWVSCSTVPGAIAYNSLVSDSVNNLKLWFKNGTTVSSYTTTIDVTQSSGDTTPPALVPLNVTMEHGDPTTLSFARFSIDSCVTDDTISGVLIQLSGGVPTKDDSRWQPCTTATGAYWSPPLVNGANTVSFYFKDDDNNVNPTSIDKAVTYNQPTIPAGDIHLTMGDGTYNNGWLKETQNRKYLQGLNTGNMVTGLTGQVGDAIDLSSNATFEAKDHNILLTNDLTVMAWVNLSQPSSAAHIIGQWNETQTDNQWSMRVDSTGRLCLDFQTVNSTTIWNTDKYKRSCSSSRVPFAEWAHIGVIRNGATLTFYINNKVAGTDSIDTGNFQATTIPYRAGAQDRGGVIAPTNGLIDEVSVWSTNLTTDQFEAAYAEGIRQNSLQDDILAQAPPIADHYWNYDSGNYIDPILSPVLGSVNLSDVPSGTPTSVTSGELGQVSDSFLFGNENQMVADVNSLALGTNFTISTWVKVNATDGGEEETLLNKWDTADTNAQEFRLYTTGLTPKFDFNTTTVDTMPDVGYNTLTSGNNLTSGTWHMVTVVRDNTHLKMFIDGNLTAYTTIDGAALEDIATRPLRVGGENTSVNFLSGNLDETVILKKSLDPNQVKYLYDQGTANTATNTDIRVSLAEPSTTVSTSTAKATIGDCGGNANYTVTLTAGAPLPGAITTPCTTGVGDVTSPPLSSGANTLYFWFGDGVSPAVDGPDLSVTKSP